MRTKISGLTAAAFLAASLFSTQPALAESEAHAHIGHVMTAWKDTPDGLGLLPTAIAEVDIAVQHASLAARKPGDLAWMQSHSGHVLNAIDPSAEPEGPGLGYGVVAATEGTISHVGFAAESGDASDAVKTHAAHVTASSQNTLDRAAEIIALVRQVKAAQAPGQARPLVEQIEVLTSQLRTGVDANGDGKVSWEPGEGGLDQAIAHMGFMMDAEGLK